MSINRTLNGIEQSINLSPEERYHIYRSVEKDYTKQDILSIWGDKKESGTLPTILMPVMLEKETDLLEKAYHYYHKIHDCNIDHNSTISAVIEQIKEWYEFSKSIVT